MAGELSWGAVLFLAVVQGVTEFLPISSSAHLLLPSQLLGFPDQGLMFDTAVHGGTLVGVIGYFRQDLSTMIRACFSINPKLRAEKRVASWLLIASLPVLIVGFLSADLVAGHLRNLWVVSWTTLLFALLLWWAARVKGAKNILTPRIIFLVGCAQTLALLPGVSRAGITMTAGLMQGLNATAASRLAFLLSIPALGAACGYGVMELIRVNETQQFVKAFTAAFLAALCAYLTIDFFLRFVRRVGLLPFILYRIALGIFLLSYLFIA